MKNCEVCGTEFKAKRATAKYCSPVCRVNASRGIDVHDGAEEGLELLVEKKSRPDIRKIAKEKREAMNPATGEVIPDRIMEETRIRRAEMNARLEAKGLPLIQSGPVKEYYVDSGVAEINELTRKHDADGVGGFPRQKITEIFGTAGSSKSSLVKLLVSNPETRVLYIDVEGGLTSPPENVDIARCSLVEDAEAIICEALEGGQYDIIILDSIAALVTKQRFEQDLEGLGSKAKGMSKLINSTMARLRPQNNGLPADSKGTAMVFINQLRDTFNPFGKKEFTPGGRSIEFMASFRLEFRSNQGDLIKKKVDGKEMIVGQWVKVKVVKTRYDVRNEVVKFKLDYETLRAFDDYYQEVLREALG